MSGIHYVRVCVFLQAFFCGRSDYFKALLQDHFSEGEQLQSQPSIPVITLHNISHEIFIHIMYYIYTDDTEVCAQFLCDYLMELCVKDTKYQDETDACVMNWFTTVP